MEGNRSLPARSTRGKRMNQLVGEDAVADNEFWKMDLFKEEEEDEEYSSEEEEEDVVDADFDKPEEEDEPEEKEGDVDVKEKKRKRAGEYVDPKSKKATQKAHIKAQRAAKRAKPDDDEPYEVISSEEGEGDGDGEEVEDEPQPISPIAISQPAEEVLTPTQPRKSSRAVALARAAERAKERQELEKKKASRPKKRAQIVVRRYTQEELLAEAKITEKINRESLKDFLLIEEERKKVKEAPAFTGPMIHYHSKNGVTTVTFPDLPPVLSQSSSATNNTQTLTCPITGLPAKYRDPKTGTPYATMQAFKLLRDKFLQKEEAKCDARLLELSILLEEKKRKKEVVSMKRKELEVALATMTSS